MTQIDTRRNKKSAAYIVMHKLYVRNTKIGPFYISEAEGRFHAVYGDQSLGNYARPEQAADDLAGGHTFSIGTGMDTATLGIPADLNEWERIPK